MPHPRIQLHVAVDQPGPAINRHLFGQFAEHLGRCVYEGIWVGEDSPIPNLRGIRQDVVAALRAIKVPNVRWPGGCFADSYHWRDGIGPRASRPAMRNETWGLPESNAFGTHEFLDFCRQVNCEPVICGNLGSGTVREMRDWVEYLNAPAGASPLARERAANGQPEPFGVRYWGVGNESWGCGGTMRAEYYADEFRRYATFLGNYGQAQLHRVACGPCVDDYHWTEVMMRECGNPRFHGAIMSGLSMHYYMNGDCPPHFYSTKFDHEGWRMVMGHAWKVDGLIRKHAEIMDRHDPKRRIDLIVDEWGSWYTAEPGSSPNELYQQQTIRDALVAALTLHSFIAHAERVRMANIAQMINVLHAMILTFGERMVLTPTWHVFHMFVAHQDAIRLPVTSSSASGFAHGSLPFPRVSASASLAPDRSVTVSIAHTDPAEAVEIELSLAPFSSGAEPVGEILESANLTDCNTPEQPKAVASRPWSGFTFDGRTLTATLPPACVTTLRFSPI